MARAGCRRSTYRVFVGRTEGKRPPGRGRHRWHNIIINAEEGILEDIETSFEYRIKCKE